MFTSVMCQCGKRLPARNEMAGKHSRCPHCGSNIWIPAPRAPQAIVSSETTSPNKAPRAAPSHAAVGPKNHGTWRQAASDSTIAIIDEVLNNDQLLIGPRAVLLLRLCQFAQIVRPDILEKYWGTLVGCGNKLPSDNRDAFEALCTAIEPPRPKDVGAFARDLLPRINEAGRLAERDIARANRLFSECEARLRKRFWPFGKQVVWTALVQTWIEADRQNGLKRLKKVSRAVQQNLLNRLNDRAPLTPADWDMAHQSSGLFGSVIPVVKNLLDGRSPTLHLSPAMRSAVAKDLRCEAIGSAPSTERDAGERYQTSYERYLKLASCVASDESDAAQALFEDFFRETAESSAFLENWPQRFTVLGRLIRDWISLPALRKSAVAFLTEKSPEFLREFCLAHAYGLLADTPDSIKRAHQLIQSKSDNKATSEAWFLVTLVRCGHESIAFDVARSSSRAHQLLPRLRRAGVCENPKTASTAMHTSDFKDDIVSQFLLLHTVQDRAKLIRALTENGSKSLPPEFWSKLDLESLLKPPTQGDSQNLHRLYRTAVPRAEQFGEYVELFGFGFYSHDDVDPLLLGALTVWDEQHPEEVSALLTSMWNSVDLNETVITESNLQVGDIDRQIRMIRSGATLRSAVLERCRMLFPAHPSTLCDVLAAWVNTRLVGKQVYCVVNNQLGHITTSETAPFTHCLIGAQNVARVSPKRRDEILSRAIAMFPASDDLLTAAGELYSVDRGFGALIPPSVLKNQSQAEAWQFGVVRAALPAVLKSLSSRQKFLGSSPICSDTGQATVLNEVSQVM